MEIEVTNNLTSVYVDKRANLATDTSGTVSQGGNGSKINVTKAQTRKGASQNKQKLEDARTSQDKNIEKQIQNLISDANVNMKKMRTNLEFFYHKETNRISIKVYNKSTKEVIREIPPEESLEMLQKIRELSGIMIDQKG